MNPLVPAENSRQVSALSEGLPVGALFEANSSNTRADLVCLSNIRWTDDDDADLRWVLAAARERRVFFIEPPVFDAPPGHQCVEICEPADNVSVIVPHLTAGASAAAAALAQEDILLETLRTFDIEDYVLWHATPQSLEAARYLSPTTIVSGWDRPDDFWRHACTDEGEEVQMASEKREQGRESGEERQERLRREQHRPEQNEGYDEAVERPGIANDREIPPDQRPRRDI